MDWCSSYSIHTESEVVEEGSRHSSKKPTFRSTVDVSYTDITDYTPPHTHAYNLLFLPQGHTVDETLSRSDFSLGDTDFLEPIVKS